MYTLYEAASDLYDERKSRRKAAAARKARKAAEAPKPVNGIGPATGKSARDYLRERDARRATGQSQDARRQHPGRAMREASMFSRLQEARMFASAAREIARLRRAGK